MSTDQLRALLSKLQEFSVYAWSVPGICKTGDALWLLRTAAVNADETILDLSSAIEQLEKTC